MSNPNRGIIELCQDLAAAGERLKKDIAERERYRLVVDAWWKSIDDNRKARLARENWSTC